MMLRRLVAIIALCLAFSPEMASAQGQQGGNAKGGKWVSLFNGRDLSGWEVMGASKDAFFVKDGVLSCNGGGGDWIRCATSFADFTLRLEYKISPEGNSGIFIHSASEGIPWKSGFEVQILDTYKQGLTRPDCHSTGAIYDVLTPMLNCVRSATEWNEIEITCVGPLTKVVLNGIKIIDADFSELTTKIGKYDIPYSELPKKGYIGFQDHHSPVWYRNIEIRPAAREKKGDGLRTGGESVGKRQGERKAKVKKADKEGL